MVTQQAPQRCGVLLKKHAKWHPDQVFGVTDSSYHLSFVPPLSSGDAYGILPYLSTRFQGLYQQDRILYL